MKQYILRDGQLDGIYDGIGLVETGKPITVRSEAHEALLAAHPAFKQYRAPKEDEVKPTPKATKTKATLTAPETVETTEAPATVKTADSGTKE